MKNRINVLILVIAASAILTACSGNEKESVTTDILKDTTVDKTTENNTEEVSFVTISPQVINEEEELEQTYESDSFFMGITGEWEHKGESSIDFFGIEGKAVEMSIVSDVSGMTESLEECKTQLCMLYNDMEGYEVISVGDITLNGREGIVINYQFEKGDSIYQGRQLVVQDDKVFYVITFLSLQDEFTDYEEDVMKMISTFKIKQ